MRALKSAMMAVSVVAACRILISMRDDKFHSPANQFDSWLNDFMDEPIELPIDGVLDYTHLSAARNQGTCSRLSRRVPKAQHPAASNHSRQRHRQLAIERSRDFEKHPEVAEFSLASEHFGGWARRLFI